MEQTAERGLECFNKHRHVVYLGARPAGHEQFIQQMGTANWHLLSADEGRIQGEQHEKCQIGLVRFDPFDPELIREWEILRRRHPHIQWLALVNRTELARPRLRELIINCFFDFHTLPIDIDRLGVSMGHAHGVAQLILAATPDNKAFADDYGLVGFSQPMMQLREMIRKAAGTDVPVLITGESGTGKELVAASIHAQSSRQGQPFVAVNCASLPGTLIQSELFGYEKGAFTGATSQKLGRIESATGGTLFLDEIGDLGLDHQANLLRFLQEKSISRLGGHAEIPVDVRIVAATHMTMEKAVEEGRFRQDLFYRLNVLRIHVPPLRARVDDIELLARYFFEKFRAEKQPHITGFSDETLTLMRHYSWPGNVREMINRIRNALILAEDKLITPEDIGLKRGVSLHDIPSLEAVRSEAERKVIVATLDFTAQNVSEASRILGVTRATLYRLIAKHRIVINGGQSSSDSLEIDPGHNSPRPIESALYAA
ncbi:MAG TPA: sigma 54-interacting transcriptional regulator [Thiobacillaceae bacterium]|nr:sigma 54-interacting transcriptional regulator [Thiobacillaceae bacterium]